jgi:hypothetical protein
MKELTRNYLRLISKVAVIDINAALYLLCDAPNIDGFNEYGRLAGAFIWSKTTQGYEYWADINTKVANNENNI